MIKPISVRLDDETKQQLEDITFVRGMSVHAFCVYAIKKVVAETIDRDNRTKSAMSSREQFELTGNATGLDEVEVGND